MYYGNTPLPTRHTAPAWASELLQYYLPKDWRIVWHEVNSQKGEKIYGCCRYDLHIVECFVSSSERKPCNEYLVLHEITHAIRGKIPRPYYRRNNIHHDEEFFRTAAKLYIDYDSTLEVLRYACDNEYRTGQYIMKAAFENPKAFMGNPFGYMIDRLMTQRSYHVSTTTVPNGTIGWFVKRNGDIAYGYVVEKRRTRYLFQELTGKLWTVRFDLFKAGSPVDVAAEGLRAELAKVAASA